MKTMNNTPKLNSFYRLPTGDMVKFTAWETSGDVSRFTFTSSRFGGGRVLTVYNTDEAKAKADSVRADFIRNRFPIDIEEKVLEATIANKVCDNAAIAAWENAKLRSETSMVKAMEKTSLSND
jgi:hypothetical protein